MSELNVRVEELSPVVRRLQIDVPADRVSHVTDIVYQRLGRTVKLRGYRQGHVPRRVLEKHFADQVRSEVAREVMKTTFPEALGSTQLSPVSEPTVEPEALTLGEGFHYAARIEVRPEVQLSQYKGLDISVPETKVPDNAVDARLEELRQAHATLEPIEGRDEAQMGDHASINYEIHVEGEKPQQSEGGLIEIKPGSFVDGHGEKLAGMKIGETREITETFTEEQNPRLVGKQARIKATLTGLKHRQLPVLDDEFAKDAEGVGTLDELKAKIRKELEDRANKEMDVAKRNAAIDALIEKNPIEAPPALVDANATQMTQDLVYNLIRAGLRLDQNAGFIERLKQDALPRAAREVKSYFLLEAVAKAENIQVSPEDANARMSRMAEEEGQSLERIQARYQRPEALAGLQMRIRNERALDTILANANVTLRPPEAEEAASEAGGPTPPQEGGAKG